eukprot:3221292-Rhodomonas_salina.3
MIERGSGRRTHSEHGARKRRKVVLAPVTEEIDPENGVDQRDEQPDQECVQHLAKTNLAVSRLENVFRQHIRLENWREGAAPG